MGVWLMEQWEEDLEIEREMERFFQTARIYSMDWRRFKGMFLQVIENIERIKNKSELMETTEDNKE
jgi:hypothetical protein